MSRFSTRTARGVVEVEAGPRADGEPAGARPDRRLRADPDPLPLPPTLPDGRPWPGISVVTPSYNQGAYIEETILSVLDQGYPNVEHIIVDGCSTDETPRVLERYADRLGRVVVEADEGQSDAINKGMALATGEILTWLNSDDMLAPGALASAAMALAESGADMVAGECHVFREGRLIHRHLTSCEDGPLPLDDLLDLERCWLAGQFFYQPEVLFTRSLWERAGGRVETRWHYSMDYELWLRFARAGARLKVIGRPIAWFRAHDGQKTAETEEGGFRGELPRVVDDFLARHPRRRVRTGGGDAPRAITRLRVVLFNDLGYRYGAGIAHGRIARALVEAGHEVRAIEARQGPRMTVREVVEAVGRHDPDVVVLGNLHAVRISPSLLGALAERFATVFLLHDLWLLTGGCAYPGGCERYLSGCSGACTCPDAYPKPDAEAIAPQWEAKRVALGGRAAPRLFANSRWTLGVVERALGEAVRRGELRAVPPTDWIRFGIELDEFRPRDRAACRREFGLPEDRFIVLTSASSLADERKGLAHLVRALEILKIPDVMVVAAGHVRGEGSDGLRVHPLGYIGDRKRLAKAYAAADVFVGPSLEEAFGQVFVEAAACGTPSVGYPVGGVPEAIADGVSGVLAREASPEALAEAIGRLWRDPELRRNLGLWGRRWAEANFSMASSAHRFHAALRACGVAVARKLSLACAPVSAPDPGYAPLRGAHWIGLEGMEGWEGPLADLGLGHFRWALGPAASLGLVAEAAGAHRLVMLVRNFHAGQSMRIERAGRVVHEAPVPVTGHERDHVVRVRLDCGEGMNRIDLRFARWGSAKADRPLAVLIHDVSLLAR